MASSLRYGDVEVNLGDVLGVGSYGKVCRARFGQLPCAAKLLHDTMLTDDGDPTGASNYLRKFQEECRFLSSIQHPNIVQYLHSTTLPQAQHRPVLLMELMDESLTRFLERSPSSLPYHTQLNISHDVALALAYLHHNDIIHRDLSSNNVLLIGPASRAKVTDFGMAKLVEANPRMTPLTQCPGATVYMPPETLTMPPQYSEKLDCFSHGVLGIQILTRHFPSPGDAHAHVEDPRFPGQQLLRQIPEADRRKKDIDLVKLIEGDHPLLSMALECLKNQAMERPSAGELCARLSALKEEERYTHGVEQARNAPAEMLRLKQEVAECRTTMEQLEQEKASLAEECQVKMQSLDEEYQAKVQDLEKEFQVKVQSLDEEYQAKVQDLKKEFQVKVQSLDEENQAKVQDLEKESQVKVQSLDEEYQAKVQDLEKECRTKIQSLEKECQFKVSLEESVKQSLQAEVQRLNKPTCMLVTYLSEVAEEHKQQLVENERQSAAKQASLVEQMESQLSATVKHLSQEMESLIESHLSTTVKGLLNQQKNYEESIRNFRDNKETDRQKRLEQIVAQYSSQVPSCSSQRTLVCAALQQCPKKGDTW